MQSNVHKLKIMITHAAQIPAYKPNNHNYLNTQI